jgi:FecR protein
MRLSGLKVIASFFLAVVLSAPAWGANQALPGTLNYVEGQASIGDQTLNSKSVGSVDLQTGQTLSTGTGKAELLLTPGVFFRLGDDSAATLLSPNLTNTEIGLAKGQAMVEVDDLHKDNLLRVQQQGATTQLLKTGIYGFDATNGAVRVFNGEALVQDGDRQVTVKGGHELDIVNTSSSGKLKTTKFNQSRYAETELYRFSNLRSEYLAEANVNAASLYWPGSPGWVGAGWYWDSAFWNYTWIPGDGFFTGPFGWGFYSPLWVGYAPYYYGYPYGYYRGRPYVAGGRPYVTAVRPGSIGKPTAFRGPAAGNVGASHMNGMGSSFHGGGMSGGGGFHR